MAPKRGEDPVMRDAMSDDAELEIGLWKDIKGYAIELRYRDPDDDGEIAPVRGRAPIDPRALYALKHDEVIYGQQLGDQLLNDSEIRSHFKIARATTERPDRSLRVRLFIDRGAPELHELRWETLRDPDDGSWLLAKGNLHFSRFLSSDDWRRVLPLRKTDLRALVVIANPAALADPLKGYHIGPNRLHRIPVDDELNRASKALGSIVPDQLVSDRPASSVVTLDGLIEALKRGYHVLYIVCHGGVAEEGESTRPTLLLEKEDGSPDFRSGLDLVERIRNLPNPPRLVVLASCQSAGNASGDGGALAALGPLLAQAGVPAVLAMQGNVRMDTIAKFMPTFFSTLVTTSQIDLAVTRARQEVIGQPDAWVPTLFLRLRSGLLWYRPGLYASDRTKEFEQWPSLLKWISRGKCTPILGIGLLESWLGPLSDLSRCWADSYRFPMAAHFVEDFPQVAQFLELQQKGKEYVCDEYAEFFRRRVSQHYADDLPDKLEAARVKQLESLLNAAETAPGKLDIVEQHRVLARLPLRLYLTTNPDKLLEQTLLNAGKVPQDWICAWKPDLEKKYSPEMLAQRYEERAKHDPSKKKEPTVDAPLVYHLFGAFEDTNSLVLTEDDYYNYLINNTAQPQAFIPDWVLRAYADSLLMFLGFRMDDWSFRILLRTITRLPGWRKDRYGSVAVQMNPEEGRMRDAERGRAYLEKYFDKDQISIFWGSLEDFLQMLRERWNADPKLAGIIKL
jgi:hypothetical protein